MKPLRIVLLGAAVSIHMQRWANGLVQRGHAVCLMSQHPCDSKLLAPEVECIWMPHARGLGYVTNAGRVRRQVRRWRADLLNAHYASGYGTTAALSGVKPTLLSVWGSDVYDFPMQGALCSRLVRWNLQRATAVASTSRAMAQQAKSLLPARSRDVAVTPFGVDTVKFAVHPQRDPDFITVGIVKTLAPKYGVDLLIRAFAGLCTDAQLAAQPNFSPLRLVVVGDGPVHGELRRLTTDLGIAERVQFVGAVAHTDVPHWLNQFDIYAAPSRLDSESFGVAVVEASACGVPVVVSDAGGLPEVVLHEKTGLVVARDDVLALQAAIKRLAMDASLRGCMGSQGRDHVTQTYDWSTCVDRMEGCYRDLLKTFASHAVSDRTDKLA